MKLSKYTIMFAENENGKAILFNTLTGAVFKLNEEYKKIIEEKNLENLTDDETLLLEKEGIIVGEGESQRGSFNGVCK
ncbi:hypothetical protein ACJQ40_002355 [Enterococcus faecium]